MTWFKKVNVEEHDKLIKNKNKMYNITSQFSTPELLNKYRDEDDDISKKIKIDEQQKIQNENLSKAFDKNLYKYFDEKEDTSKYNDEYSFENNNDILQSFIKVFNKYDLSYNPRLTTTKINSQYLLDKLEKSKKISKELFQHFDTNLIRKN